MQSSSLFFVMAIGFLSGNSSCDSNHVEIEALMAFKHNIFSDTHGVLTNWNGMDSSPCNWTGVSCIPGTWKVNKLSLGGTNFTGHLVPELGNLTHLVYLNLSANQFNGTIPSELGRLKSLTVLDLSYNNFRGHLVPALGNLIHLNLSANKFSGTIPSELGRLKSLIVLDLGYNNLQGQIPIQLGRLQSLEFLCLRNNRNLSGNIPSVIGKMSSLKILWASFCNLSGSIPPEIGQLINLQYLDLAGNRLSGTIPVEIAKLKNLMDLELYRNEIEGHIPSILGNMTNLKVLGLAHNQLNGSIPLELSKLQLLQGLSLQSNNLSGDIPVQLCQLKNLLWFGCFRNQLTGSIPKDVNQLKKLRYLNLDKNKLSGSIPLEVGDLRDLEFLHLSSNHFSGVVPEEFRRLTNLQVLSVANNSLSGEIPQDLGYLPNLWFLHAQSNNLGGHIPLTLANLRQLKHLDLSNNRIAGIIPAVLANCSNLRYIQLDNNELYGEIPSELSYLRNLSILTVSHNHLKGRIPESFASLGKLKVINLSKNGFVGTLPHSWEQNEELQILMLGYNKLEGSLPSWIWRLKKLILLDLSNNNLTGQISIHASQVQALERQFNRSLQLDKEKFTDSIPAISSSYKFWSHLFEAVEVDPIIFNFKGYELPFSQFYTIEMFLDLSGNQLSGRIPSEIGLLKVRYLREVNISRNQLRGNIPKSIGDVTSLESLDLSNNYLEGRIPDELSRLHGLEMLDFSHNNLSGPIPIVKLWPHTPMVQLLAYSAEHFPKHGFAEVQGFARYSIVLYGGQFNTFNASSYVGNIELCGPPLSASCTRNNSSEQPSSGRETDKRYTVVIIAGSIVGSILILGLSFCCYMYSSRKSIGHLNMHSFDDNLKLKVEDISKCHNNANVISESSLSVVYKATLADGRVVAVKKFKLNEQMHVERNFKRECKILSKIRHRNLVRIMGAFSNSNIKALVLQFIPNGSLDTHLHAFSTCALSLEKRLNIAVGIAQAMLYLHEESGIGEIVHCDLKPSNVLLDDDFEAHVTDFGIAKLIDPKAIEYSLSSTVIGSIGYIAPEFAYGKKVSKEVDIYSFGILLLEIVSGKRPTSDEFKGEISLHEWVRSSFPDRVFERVDSTLTSNATSGERLQIISLLRLALLCCQESPRDRPSMRKILANLKQIKCNMRFADNLNMESVNRIIWEPC
eukprot:Gb_23616 [translate_table: standard]